MSRLIRIFTVCLVNLLFLQRCLFIAVYTHCQMNENPCSNQEIHVLFEHGSELENTKNEPCIICDDVIYGKRYRPD